MKFRSFVFVAFVLVSTCTGKAQPQQEQQSPKFKGPDHSLRGGEYAILNNILWPGVRSVEYAGKAEVEVYGNIYEASKFIVRDFVRVTVSGAECYNDSAPFQPCGTSKGAQIEVYVGRDESNEIHDLMLQRIYDFWTANKPGKGKKVDAEEHLNYKDGEYIMFQSTRGQETPRTHAKRLVWVDGKFIKFRFVEFDLGPTYNDVANIKLDADEGLESFVGMGTYLRPRAIRIQPKLMKGAFRDEFFRLYLSGAFGRVPRTKPNEGVRPNISRHDPSAR
ncbi:MAG: hypothetical protein QOG71_3236 [Pyrinomonadaceae bacterium]|nr:hypothetical protein [Pyrinomonadaceae bacterium]